MSMLLTVIIVNYNVKYYLHQCLEALRRAADGLEWEVYVVDNNSTDGSVEYLREAYPQDTFPQLHVMANHENVGFGKANNQAFLASQGEYVLYLNPDTFVSEDTLWSALDFMRQHPEAGCLGVKMLNADGSFAMESRRGVPTPWVSFCKITRLAKLFPRSKVFGRYYLQHLPIDEAAPIDIVSGACMMVRRDIVSEVGIFDDDYFMYCEDTDLSYRMLKAGHQNYYVPTQILHYKGESSKRHSYSFTNIFYKAILIFFRKHYSHHFFLLRIFINMAIYVLGVFSFLRGQYRKLVYNISTAVAPHPPVFFCLVSPDNQESLVHLAQRKELELSCHTQKVTTPQQLAQLVAGKKIDYLLYDTSVYDFKDILRLAHSLPAKNRVSIATLLPQQRLLLTNTYIFQL